MGNNPSFFTANGRGKDRVPGQSTDRHPVEQVGWLDAVKFCNKLSEREGIAPFYEIDGCKVTVADWNRPGYRLPTEAEWQYACRANTSTRYPFGDDAARLGEYGWFSGNSGDKTHPVGEKRPNGFGLYDMLGNVSERCWDAHDEPSHMYSGRCVLRRRLGRPVGDPGRWRLPGRHHRLPPGPISVSPLKPSRIISTSADSILCRCACSFSVICKTRFAPPGIMLSTSASIGRPRRAARAPGVRGVIAHPLD